MIEHEQAEFIDLDCVMVSSIFEETPEALFVMDRLRRDHDAARAAMDPVTRELLDVVDREVDRIVLGL